MNWIGKYYINTVQLIAAVLALYRGMWMAGQTQEACEAFLRVAVVNGTMNGLIIFGLYYTILQTLTLVVKYRLPDADT